MASQELEEVDESLEEMLEEAKDVLLPEDRAFDGRGCRYYVSSFCMTLSLVLCFDVGFTKIIGRLLNPGWKFCLVLAVRKPLFLPWRCSHFTPGMLQIKGSALTLQVGTKSILRAYGVRMAIRY